MESSGNITVVHSHLFSLYVKFNSSTARFPSNQEKLAHLNIWNFNSRNHWAIKGALISASTRGALFPSRPIYLSWGGLLSTWKQVHTFVCGFGRKSKCVVVSIITASFTNWRCAVWVVWVSIRLTRRCYRVAENVASDVFWSFTQTIDWKSGYFYLRGVEFDVCL